MGSAVLKVKMNSSDVSFKVSLLDKDNVKSQVRRFVVPEDCSTSVVYLREKLRGLFGPTNLSISWQDEDGDTIVIESDEELTIAVQEMAGPVYKIQVKFEAASAAKPEEAKETPAGPREQHPGVQCDAC